MNRTEQLQVLEGLHTVETVADTLKITKQSALNLLVKLKKQQHMTVSGGGRRKRLYKITMRKQLPRVSGMWDILNKYNPHFKLNSWYDHQVQGKYTVEDVIVDAIETKSFRIIVATLRLFNHVTNWPKLYQNAQKKGNWQKVGALYEVAKLFFKVRQMPEKYKKNKMIRKLFFFNEHDTTTEEIFNPIEHRWKVPIPFRIGDLQKVGA
ncbi:MAG: hypothetical protein AABX37_01895 [Nanoarchaeota archaeon]